MKSVSMSTFVFKPLAAAAIVIMLTACIGSREFSGLGDLGTGQADFSSLPSSGHLVASKAGTTIPVLALEQRMQNKGIGKTRASHVPYTGKEAPGTIVIEQSRQSLYFVEEGGKAMKYVVAIGSKQNQWSGISGVTGVHLQPGWTPPASMRRAGVEAPVYESGAANNPMGIGALTLAGGDYAIHGTNRPDSIGRAVSGGCFRMFNEDVADLMKRVRVGTKVVVNR
jgi:lipoprotein-anchoring transpeptidase ErfK/SrfK